MLRLRFRTEFTARTKNGQPAQRHTGVANASWIHDTMRAEIGTNPDISIIASTVRGAVKTTEPQNRRVMSFSSWFSGSAAVTVRGSRAIPQIGHAPGSDRTTSGCIGHVHSTDIDGAAGISSSRAIPHFGHAPGFLERTSGSMGQIHTGVLSCSGAPVLTCGAELLACWGA